MKLVLMVVGSFLLLQACNVDKGKKVDADQLAFDTDDRSEMFFKNVRQSYYQIEENKDGGIFLYTNKSWQPSDKSPLTATIVFNWRQDKAYIMLNWSDSLENAAELKVLVKNDSLPDRTFSYRHGNMKDQLNFAVSLYNSRLDGSSFYLTNPTGVYPLFNSQEDAETFRITIFDYLRLTGWF